LVTPGIPMVSDIIELLNVENSDQDSVECVEDNSCEIHACSEAEETVEMLISSWKP
jgi:hypothetical protein